MQTAHTSSAFVISRPNLNETQSDAPGWRGSPLSFVSAHPLVHKDAVKDGLMRRELIPAVMNVVERLQSECDKKYIRMIDLAGECLDPRARKCFGDDAFLHDGVPERVAETVFRFIQASPSGAHECERDHLREHLVT